MPFKHLKNDLTNVGESWEISAVEGSESVVADGADKGLTLTEMVRKYGAALTGASNYKRFGEKFPLLVKFIDARLDLSIQVHPGDELAWMRHRCFGKNEMWYVLEADEGAKLIAGFAGHVTPQCYNAHVADGTLDELVYKCGVRPGDICYVPSGRVHGIGGGIFLVEIQQTSDVTYRIFDYNRKDKQGKPRELHTQLALDAINFNDIHDDPRTPYTPKRNEPVELMVTPHFTTSLYDLTEEMTCDYSELDSFVIYVCVEGSCRLTDNEGNVTEMQAGESLLLPASLQEVVVMPMEHVKFLETYV